MTYLIFDTETVPDGELLAAVYYRGQGLTPDQAVAKRTAELVAAGKPGFIPAPLQMPVSVGTVQVKDDHEIHDVVALDAPQYRTPIMAHLFWSYVRDAQPTLVTFNGRCFDLPVMEAQGIRYGMPAFRWWDNKGPNYTISRGRYAVDRHLDLQDWISNYGAVTVDGGLARVAISIGAPGKLDTAGNQVYGMWQAGKLEEINQYCLCDALSTYIVFLRYRRMLEFITAEREKELRVAAKAFAAARPHLKIWADAFTRP